MTPASGRSKPSLSHLSGALGYRKALHRASLGEAFHKPRLGLGKRSSEWPGPRSFPCRLSLTSVVALDQSLTLPVPQSPHLDVGGERSQVCHVCPSWACLGPSPGQEREEQMKEGLSRPAGRAEHSQHLLPGGAEGCSWLTGTAEEVTGSGWLFHGERGRALEVGATEEQQTWEGDMGGCCEDGDCLVGNLAESSRNVQN